MNKYTSNTFEICYLTPIWNNSDFPPGVKSAIFQRWYSVGIRVIGDLFETNILMSFTQIQEKYGIPQKDFFAYLQVGHFVQANLKNTQTVLPGPMQKFVLELSVKKSVIKQCCANLQSYNKHNIRKVIDRWEEDLQLIMMMRIGKT